MISRTICDAWMETPNVRTIRLDFRDRPVSFQPGQFVVLAAPFRHHPRPVRRAYSIASSPHWRDYLDVTVKREVPGLMSTYLTSVPIGTPIDCSEPGGKFLYDESAGRRILLLGAGSGITPLHSIARYALEGDLEDTEVICYYSVRTVKDIIYKEIWQELQQRFPERFRFYLTVTRATPAEWSGHHGRLSADWVRDTEVHVQDCLAFLCGPEAFIQTGVRVCGELGLPPEHIHQESW